MSTVKHLAITVMISLALAMLSVAYAQTGVSAKVEVPFAFSVDGTELGAGTYTVTQLQPGVVAFTAGDGQVHKLALTRPEDVGNHSGQPNLVFTRYSSEAFLNRIFLTGDNECNQLLPTSREKQLRKLGTSGEEFSLLLPPTN